MIYRLLRPLLFAMDPEQAHHFTLQCLKWFRQTGLIKKIIALPIPQKPKNVFGITFPNPVGLAAGLDKNGDYIDALLDLGFGFIEVGTVTPKPQSGNAKPRLFRLPEADALINRMGFNNKGVDYLVEKLKQRKVRGVVGVNIGKNAQTPLEKAVDDYRECLIKVFPYADYVTINISSPNTPQLRALQSPQYLSNLLSELKSTQQSLSQQNNQRKVPLLVKITVDLVAEDVEQLVDILLAWKVEGIIASNTTVDHSVVEKMRYGTEQGGLSGRPLHSRAIQLVKLIHEISHGELPIIAVGGILSKKDALDMFAAGASLIQIYTGLIYNGPGLIRDILE